MRKYAVIIALTFGAFFAVSSPALAATECYGFGSTTNEHPVTSQNRVGQQYTPSYPTDLLSVSMNIVGDPLNTGFFHFQIHETTAGIPNAVIVAGSQVQIASNTVPSRAVGVGQAFTCGALPPLTTFTFAAPVTLTAGQMYALTVYNTTGTVGAHVGYVAGDFPGIAPGAGLDCVGVGCPAHAGWALNNFFGFNADMVYSLENELVVAGDGADLKIDSNILRFREWLRLTGDTGGLVFAVGIVAIMFLFGLGMKIPFPIIGMLATLLIASLARAEIIAPWIVIAVVAVAGTAMVFLVASSTGGSKVEE